MNSSALESTQSDAQDLLALEDGVARPCRFCEQQLKHVVVDLGDVDADGQDGFLI